MSSKSHLKKLALTGVMLRSEGDGYVWPIKRKRFLHRAQLRIEFGWPSARTGLGLGERMLNRILAAILIAGCLFCPMKLAMAAICAPAADRQFIWVARGNDPYTDEPQQFSDAEIQEIAENYSYLIIT